MQFIWLLAPMWCLQVFLSCLSRKVRITCEGRGSSSLCFCGH